MQVFYSRRIGSAPLAPSLRNDASNSEELVDVPTPATIYGAGKLVGRGSPNWTIGALSALTAANHVSVYDNVNATTTERLAAPVTAFNVLRLKRELGAGGHIGIIGTGSSTYESDGGLHGAGRPDGFFARALPLQARAPLLGSSCFHERPSASMASGARRRAPTSSTAAFIESFIRGVGRPPCSWTAR